MKRAGVPAVYSKEDRPLGFMVRFRRGPLSCFLGSACGSLFPNECPAAQFTRLFVVLSRAKLFLHPAPLDELLEPAQRQSDGFLVVHPHSQSHSYSSLDGKSALLS